MARVTAGYCEGKQESQLKRTVNLQIWPHNTKPNYAFKSRLIKKNENRPTFPQWSAISERARFFLRFPGFARLPFWEDKGLGEDEYGAMSDWYDRGNPKSSQKNPSQCHSIHHKSVWFRVFAVRGRRPTAWPTARTRLNCVIYKYTHIRVHCVPRRWAGIAQLLQRLAMGCTIRRSNPGRRDFPYPSRPDLRPTQPPMHGKPVSFPGVKRPEPGVHQHWHRVPRLKKE